MLFTKDYAGASDVLAWIMVAGAVGYVASVLGYGLTAARRFAIQAPLAALVTGVTATASVLLIPHYGLVGAAWATTAGTATQAIGSGVLLHGVLAGSKPQAAAGS
jgi:O-antigen/teichoic acid export membrane protein